MRELLERARERLEQYLEALEILATDIDVSLSIGSGDVQTEKFKTRELLMDIGKILDYGDKQCSS